MGNKELIEGLLKRIEMLEDTVYGRAEESLYTKRKSTTPYKPKENLEDMFVRFYDLDSEATRKLTVTDILKEMGLYTQNIRAKQRMMSPIAQKYLGGYHKTRDGRFYDAPPLRVLDDVF